MFKLETFVEDCRAAVKEDPTHKSVHEIMKRALSDPRDVLNTLGEPDGPCMQTIYRSDDLTILNLVWKPHITILPHNHDMWAVIGIYTGREDNIFWRRSKGCQDGRIEAAGAKALSAGDVAPLGKDVIHSVINPLTRYTGALHIYGGDFFEAERLEWEAEGLTERRWDPERAKALFEDG